MSNLITVKPSAISIKSNKLITNSIIVCEIFNKRHRDIVRKINTIDCSKEFLTANFCAVKFDHKGNVYDSFDMTKDGFMFLVMGFTGKKAARIKEAYINAFNKMAEQQQKPERIENTVYISDYYKRGLEQIKASQALAKANEHKPKSPGIEYYYRKAMGMPPREED